MWKTTVNGHDHDLALASYDSCHTLDISRTKAKPALHLLSREKSLFHFEKKILLRDKSPELDKSE